MIRILSFILISTLLFACKQDPIVKDTSETIPEEWQETISIKSLVETYLTFKGSFTPVRNNSGTSGLYSVDSIPTQGPELIINGRVISEDIAGNMYKNMTIQSLTPEADGTYYSLKISVDAAGLSSMYPIGQVIAIKCNGLAVGKYADMAQLGIPYFNSAQYEPDTKKGWEPGRIPLNKFLLHSKAIGLPSKEKVGIQTMTIPELNEIKNNLNQTNVQRATHSRIIKLENVHFRGEGLDFGEPKSLEDSLQIFAPSTGGIGFPQSRLIRDSDNNWIALGTSEYSKFAQTRLPSKEFKGTVYALISYYNDKSSNTVAKTYPVSLVIRSLDDLILYNDEGIRWNP